MKKLLFPILTMLVLSACQSDDDTVVVAPASATLTFDSRVGAADFALKKDFTINSRTYNFTKLRYWVSNVTLVGTNGVEYAIPNSYYLLEETGDIKVQDGSFTYPARKREDVLIPEIPAGTYKSVKFSIGVDSKYNDNLSLQAGELSQLSGMTNISWMWHTSYIFSSLAGTVTEGTATKTIQAETGLNANFKTVTLSLPAEVTVEAGKNASIVFNVDVTKLITGLDLITTPIIGASQAEAMTKLANNYTQAIVAASGK